MFSDSIESEVQFLSPYELYITKILDERRIWCDPKQHTYSPCFSTFKIPGSLQYKKFLPNGILPLSISWLQLMLTYKLSLQFCKHSNISTNPKFTILKYPKEYLKLIKYRIIHHRKALTVFSFQRISSWTVWWEITGDFRTWAMGYLYMRASPWVLFWTTSRSI